MWNGVYKKNLVTTGEGMAEGKAGVGGGGGALWVLIKINSWRMQLNFTLYPQLVTFAISAVKIEIPQCLLVCSCVF